MIILFVVASWFLILILGGWAGTLLFENFDILTEKRGHDPEPSPALTAGSTVGWGVLLMILALLR